MLSRIPDQRYAEAIGRGLWFLPDGIRRKVEGVRFVCGVDPIFAGYGPGIEATPDGRSYRDTAHVCYPCHFDGRPASDRVTTVIFPSVPHLATVVHELGHALDWSLGRKHIAQPVTAYARTNRDEAFAEALTAWTFRDGYYGDPNALHADGATIALFRELESC